ncbi:MAG TPA: DUF3048 C-terminal domain-containing protein [Streptosporangiales bacterium]
MTRRAALAAVLTAVAVGSGCAHAAGGDASASPLWSTTPPSPQASTSAAASSGTPAPLTGLPVSGAAAAAPAVAVPLVESDGGAKPAGLSHADLVYQEFDRPGTSHLLAVYQSRTAARVGPVDITRPVDVKLLPVLHPAFGYAGGPMGFVVQVENAGLHGVNRVTTPEAFHGSYTSTTLVGRRAGHGLSAPPPVLSFAEAGDPLGEHAAHADSLTVRVPGQQTQVWSYDAGTKLWRRTEGGSDVAVANVVVQRVAYKNVVNRHLAGGATASALAIGHGTCVAVSRGQSVACTWSRPGRDRQTNYSDATAAALEFQPGATWVLLAPPGTRVTT